MVRLSNEVAVEILARTADILKAGPGLRNLFPGSLTWVLEDCSSPSRATVEAPVSHHTALSIEPIPSEQPAFSTGNDPGGSQKDRRLSAFSLAGLQKFPCFISHYLFSIQRSE